MPNNGPRKNARKLYFAGLFAMIVLGSVALVYGLSNWTAARRARKMPNPVPSTVENLKAGLKIYNDHCVQCHGDRGDGQGEKAAQLSAEPGNFTDSRKMRGLTDGDLYWQITKGHHPMPGYEDKLTPFERWQAVDYIRSFTALPQTWQSPSGAARTPPPVPGQP